MKHPVSRELHAYWDDLRGTRVAPERGDLDPAAIRSILADTFVIEVTGGSPGGGRDFPIRLSGTRLNALFLDELKGRSLLSIWRPEDRDAALEILGCVLDERAPVVAGAKAAPRGHPAVELEMLLLPLRHHGKTHARILGSLAPFHVPSWLGLLAAQRLALGAFRNLEGMPPASRPASFVPRLPPPPTRHGRFVVYEGGLRGDVEVPFRAPLTGTP